MSQAARIAHRREPIAEGRVPREAREILEALRALMALQRPPGLEGHGMVGHARKWKWRVALAARLGVSHYSIAEWWNGTRRPNETNLQALRALLEAERGVAA